MATTRRKRSHYDIIDIWHVPVCSVEWISKLDTNCLSGSQRVEVSRVCVTEEQCLEHGWSLTGDACNDSNITSAVPDVFLLSVILFLGTFTVAMTLKMFRTSRFFPTVVRTVYTRHESFPRVFIVYSLHSFIGVGAQSTLGGKTFLPEKICMKK